jgi:hypothetical protein
VQVFTLLLLPDTKHVPLEVINKRWATHWLWRHVYHNKHQPQLEDSTAANGFGPPAAAAAAGASGSESSSSTKAEQQAEAAGSSLQESGRGSAQPVQRSLQQLYSERF